MICANSLFGEGDPILSVSADQRTSEVRRTFTVKIVKMSCNRFLTVLLILDCILLSVVADRYHPFHAAEESSSRNKRQTNYIREEEKLTSYWNDQAQHRLQQQLTRELNFNVAKNVILFLGDGMSIPTLSAARAYMGKLEGSLSGEETHLYFDDFPHTGLSKTYCVDKQVADSACSATAYLCGVKANYGTIGVNAAVPNNNCTASNDPRNHVDSIAAWAQKAGKGTGIVTTSRVTHASPSGAFAHVANREWECDADVESFGNDPRSCDDIARQLVHGEPGKNFKVIFGGGRKKFLPKSFKFLNGESGQRNDGANLIKEWLQQKKTSAKFIYDKKGLLELDYNNTEYVMGLFESSHMKFNLDANPDTQPTLAEMTEAAIKMMHKEKNGYFLFVEGARIDHGHHESKAAKALDETVQLSNAVRMAAEMTSRQDTLIVVTSDHAHTMTMSGYSLRGSNVLGLNSEVSDMDQKPYTTLNYANGPGYKETVAAGRYNLVNDTFSKNYIYPSSAPLKSETHGGDDVGVFALGPWSHLFTGVYEQNLIPHVMAYASCIGDGLSACRSPNTKSRGGTGSSPKSVDTSVKIFH